MRFKDFDALDELLKNQNLPLILSILTQKLEIGYPAARQVFESSLFSCHEVEMEDLYPYFKFKLHFPLRPFNAVEHHFNECTDCRKRYAKESEILRRNPRIYLMMIKRLYAIKEQH